MGNPQRTGVTVIPPKVAFSPRTTLTAVGEVNLPHSCRCLMIQDGFLVAVSSAGVVKIVNLARGVAQPVADFSVGGPVIAHPAIWKGTLYIAAGETVHAFTLGRLLEKGSDHEPRWRVRLESPPVRCVMPIRDRLFLTIAPTDGSEKVLALEGTKGHSPPKIRPICEADKVSHLSGNLIRNLRNLYFLSKSDATYVHMVDCSQRTMKTPQPVKVGEPFEDFRARIPISVVGAQIFAVSRGEDCLCRLDTTNGQVVKTFGKQVRGFAVAGLNDPVLVDRSGLNFPSMCRKISFSDGHQSIVTSPAILRNWAVALGMKDGNVRLYNLRNPELPIIWNVSDSVADRITSIAASGNIIASGNDKGLVKICCIG